MTTAESTSVYPFATLGVTRVAGRDARDYLNRRLCQKIVDIPAGHGRRAFLLDAIGKMQLDLEVYAEEGGLLLLAPAAGRELVIGQLEKYVFTEDCTFEDVSDQYEAFAVMGPRGHELLGEVDVPVPTRHNVVHADGILACGSDYALGECLVLVPRIQLPMWTQCLEQAERASNASVLNREEFEALRIRGGFPAWLTDVTPDDMPLDAPSLRHGVHFNKGCFPGQEALARVENLGHPARCLVRLESRAMPRTGDRVLRDEDTDEEVGRITSIAHDTRHSAVVALGMVKWAAREAGRRFHCGEILFESLGSVHATEALGR
jgi:folate-binding protein YgfZ